MSRLSNSDVDALIHDQYEDALADGEPWAVESYRVRQGEALLAEYEAEHGEITNDEVRDLPWQT